MKKNKNGFTLVELLVVMAIIVILAMMMTGVLNPIALINKGSDAKRKKDLYRIKVAFEEYFNDKGTYPQDVSVWNIKDNCNSNIIFSPYLMPWPCDPNGEPYKILVGINNFRVLADLQNRSDKDIPINWYTRTDIEISGVGRTAVNYGVSSTNIKWYSAFANKNCDTTHCAKKNSDTGTGCKDVDFSKGCNLKEDGVNCYYRSNGDCTDECQTSCCGVGCN